jgi:hypothetical protein
MLMRAIVKVGHPEIGSRFSGKPAAAGDQSH